jgi:hypothetical protein
MTSPSLTDLRFAVTDTQPAALVAVALEPDINVRATRWAKDHNVSVNILRVKDGYDLVAKVGPSGLRIDVSPPPPK